ncbi:MAG TPA: hypothetical protein VL200_00415 [Lacunisphaera sp.]|jgi:hypothetical protein|nr:hypothetical protein [Lacunisphaera sp.]
MVVEPEHLEENRVRRHTDEAVQASIDESTRRNLAYFAAQPAAILDGRVEELDWERDIEQVLEMNAATLAFAGAALGTIVNRRFFLLTGVVLGFLGQHAIKGWCPPVPILRRAGLRARTEINQEKFALKALRGDFAELKGAADDERVDRALAAVAL